MSKRKLTVSICYMTYHILCSKCPAMADTYASSRLQKSYTASFMAFSGKTYQISSSASLNQRELLLASIAAWNKIPALPQTR